MEGQTLRGESHHKTKVSVRAGGDVGLSEWEDGRDGCLS